LGTSVSPWRYPLTGSCLKLSRYESKGECDALLAGTSQDISEQQADAAATQQQDALIQQEEADTPPSPRTPLEVIRTERTFLAPVDDSEHSEAAVRWAAGASTPRPLSSST
jgi:hypothetical protein